MIAKAIMRARGPWCPVADIQNNRNMAAVSRRKAAANTTTTTAAVTIRRIHAFLTFADGARWRPGRFPDFPEDGRWRVDSEGELESIAAFCRS
jgi:hypothetical protein